MQKLLMGTALSTMLAFVGCEGEREAGEIEDPTPSPAPEVEEVTEQTHQYEGKTVTLVGEVDEVHSDRAFELEGLDWIFDDQLVVLTAQPVKLGTKNIDDDDEVIVTGTVRDRADPKVGTELGWDVDSALEMNDGPVVIAESIRKVDEYASWSADEPETATVAMWTLYIEPDPESFEGKEMSFSKATVRSKMGKGLWVGENHLAQVFVAPPSEFDLNSIQPGDKVEIDGTLKKMPDAKEAIKQWNLPQTIKGQVGEEALYIDAKSLEKVEQEDERRAGLNRDRGSDTAN